MINSKKLTLIASLLPDIIYNDQNQINMNIENL